MKSGQAIAWLAWPAPTTLEKERKKARGKGRRRERKKEGERERKKARKKETRRVGQKTRPSKSRHSPGQQLHQIWLTFLTLWRRHALDSCDSPRNLVRRALSSRAHRRRSQWGRIAARSARYGRREELWKKAKAGQRQGSWHLHYYLENLQALSLFRFTHSVSKLPTHR